MVDLLLADVAKLEFEERLTRLQKLHALQMGRDTQSGLTENLLLNLSNWLIGTGELLRQRAEMRPSTR